MAARKRGLQTRKRRGDPGQLNLFEAPERRARAPERAPLPRVNDKRVAVAQPERPVILSPREAAAYLGVAVSTLKSWRAKRIGPLWQRRGARLVFLFRCRSRRVPTIRCARPKHALTICGPCMTTNLVA
jgi:hypothetical protein